MLFTTALAFLASVAPVLGQGKFNLLPSGSASIFQQYEVESELSGADTPVHTLCFGCSRLNGSGNFPVYGIQNYTVSSAGRLVSQQGFVVYAAPNGKTKPPFQVVQTKKQPAGLVPLSCKVSRSDSVTCSVTVGGTKYSTFQISDLNGYYAELSIGNGNGGLYCKGLTDPSIFLTADYAPA